MHYFAKEGAILRSPTDPPWELDIWLADEKRWVKYPLAGNQIIHALQEIDEAEANRRMKDAVDG